MSVKVSNWAWHEARDREGNKLTGNAFVLLALADVADDDGSCLRFTPGEEGLTYDALAKKTGVDRRTIIRLVAKLREEQLVEHRPGVKGRVNEFVVFVPWSRRSGDNLAPNAPGDSVTDSPDSVTDQTVFGDNPRTHSSYRRIDATDVSTSSVEQRPMSVGQRFAQPLCDVLAVELKRNEVKYTISKKWLADARLMVDADGRDPHEARDLIQWASQGAAINARPTSSSTQHRSQ